MAPLRIGIVVVAKAHILGGGVHDIDTVAFRSHPVCNDLFGRGLAPGGILAGGGIRHAVLLQHGEAVGAIGAGVGSDLCHFLCALIGGGLQLGIAHGQRCQIFLCTLSVDQRQHFLCETVLTGAAGVGEDHHPVIAVLAALVVANANGGGILVQHPLLEEIVAIPGGDHIRSILSSCPVVLAHRNIVHTVLRQDGELAAAIGAVVGVIDGKFFCTGLCGSIQCAAAHAQRSHTSLCTLCVDELQQLIGLGSCVCGHCQNKHQADECGAADQILQDFHRSVTHGVEPLLCCPMKKGVDCWYTRQSTPDASDEGHSTPNLRCGDPQVMRSNWLPFYRPYSFASQPFDCFAEDIQFCVPFFFWEEI